MSKTLNSSSGFLENVCCCCCCCFDCFIVGVAAALLLPPRLLNYLYMIKIMHSVLSVIISPPLPLVPIPEDKTNPLLVEVRDFVEKVYTEKALFA